jgi:hypothetical protein
MKLKAFYIVKEIIDRRKKQPIEQEKCFPTIHLAKDKYPECIRNIQKYLQQK